MKKLILIPALVLGTMAMAKDYSYEITPLVGYNLAEGNIQLDDYVTYGAEFQYNNLNTLLKPELSFFYSKADYRDSDDDSDIYRIALSGVYEYQKVGPFLPLVKAGIGYESMNDGSYTGSTGNTDSAFVNFGLGTKVPFTDMIALKLEAIYMLKYNDLRYDNNLALVAGLNFAFGEKAQKAAPVVVVDGDDDNDGVLNSKDECLNTPAGAEVDATGCEIDGDDDNDGVLNSQDKCAATPAGTEVDATGCEVDGDDDNDGVLNSKDTCPNTPQGDVVNINGCSVTMDFHVQFEYDSDVVQKSSYPKIKEHAKFLNNFDGYNIRVVGYTDNKGSAAYNQKLSEKRANSVKKLLIKEGVSADRITTVGRGEKNPVATNDSKEGRAKNRRIEAELTKK